jgi:hypothetical protein
MSRTRTIASFLAEMPKTESLEDARWRVAVAWEDVRDLVGVGHRPYAVEVDRFYKAAQIHRDRIERQASTAAA